MLSLGIGGIILKVALALGAVLAAWLGIKGYGASRERRGEAKATTRIVENNARIETEMAKIDKPTEDEALKRLEDGTA